MAKRNNGSDPKIEKGGYQPLNKGYTPMEHRGYSPQDTSAPPPKAPVGGTGQTPPAAGSGDTTKK